jgi:hypothetical protein
VCVCELVGHAPPPLFSPKRSARGPRKHWLAASLLSSSQQTPLRDEKSSDPTGACNSSACTKGAGSGTATTVRRGDGARWGCDKWEGSLLTPKQLRVGDWVPFCRRHIDQQIKVGHACLWKARPVQTRILPVLRSCSSKWWCKKERGFGPL